MRTATSAGLGFQLSGEDYRNRGDEARSKVPDEEVQKAELLKSLVVFVHFRAIICGILVNLLSIFVGNGQLSVHSSFIWVFVWPFFRSIRGASHFRFDRRLFACFAGFLGFLVHFWVHF
jgi:predicted histidine transporter YuiF (NhaC family)